MLEKIITTILTFVLSTTLGYCVKALKVYKEESQKKKENENIQNEALKMMLQSELTHTHYVYKQMGSIPDYVFKNWHNLFKIYKKLGGNDFIDTLKKKMSNWEITPTDILDKSK